MKTEIIPGILARTLEEYTTKLQLVEKSGSVWVHIDVMDGQFVPNITVMPHEFMSTPTTLKSEAHLMTHRPERYFSDLTVAGVSRVLLHREVYETLEETAHATKHARDYFPEVILCINPETPLESYSDLSIDGVQCMGVHPGASGQPFIESVYDTIETLHRKQSNYVIEVDGGVHEENIVRMQELGASRFVISSHIFVTNSVSANIQNFSQLVGGV